MKMFRKAGLVLLCAALAAATAFTGCSKGSGSSSSAGSSSSGAASSSSSSSSSSASGASGTVNVAFVYVGPVGDYGYTYAQDQGRKYLEKEMPNVKTTFVENVPETADCERIFTQLAQKNQIIIGTSYGYMDYMVDVSKKFPNVVFEHCSGYKTTANMGTYFDRDYQARYLTGMVAGAKSKSNLLGFICPFGTPEVIRNVDAFTLGAQSVNPSIKVKVVWTNSWNDPATEKTAANSLMDAGADVLAMHVDSPTFAQAAQARGVFAIGHDADMLKYAPKSILVGDVSNWGAYFVSMVKSVEDKTWKNDQYFGGIKDGGVIDITGFNDTLVPKDVQQKVLAKKSEIVAGTFDPFSGPVYDQSGAQKVAKGAHLTDEQLTSINWFVKGVEGTIPKS